MKHEKLHDNGDFFRLVSRVVNLTRCTKNTTECGKYNWSDSQTRYCSANEHL